MHHIRLFLDMPEVLGLCSFVFQTFLMGMKHDVCFTDAVGDVFSSGEVNSLRDAADITDGNALCQLPGQFHNRFLAHAVDEQIGTRITKDTFLQTVLPVVIVS